LNTSSNARVASCLSKFEYHLTAIHSVATPKANHSLRFFSFYDFNASAQHGWTTNGCECSAAAAVQAKHEYNMSSLWGASNQPTFASVSRSLRWGVVLNQNQLLGALT
jgi:hypothetical protein